jgi:hypothetical protein
MKKLIFILIVFASCNSGANKNELMTSLINKRKNLSDSLDFYNKIDANAKLSVDTLSDSDLLRVGSSFLSEQSKIRIDLIPTIASLNEELKAVNLTIDSLSKMK